MVVSMGAMAASGGYWLAADADAIMASPTTLTGSIGIFGAIPTVEKTLAHLGIHGDGLGTTDIAHFGNPTTAMSQEEASALQMDVEQGYRQFIEIVAKGRKMSTAQVEKIAEGRVWDGATALKLGLVDKLGNLQDAIAEAAKRAQVPESNRLSDRPDSRQLSGTLQADRTAGRSPGNPFAPIALGACRLTTIGGGRTIRLSCAQQRPQRALCSLSTAATGPLLPVSTMTFFAASAKQRGACSAFQLPLEHRQRLQFDHHFDQVALIVDNLADVLIGPRRLFEVAAVAEGVEDVLCARACRFPRAG